VLLLGRDPDDPDGESGNRRVLAQVKSNVGPHAPSLAFTLEPVTLDAGGGIETVRLIERGRSRFTGSELLGEQQRGASKLEQAISLLQSELTDGPKPVKELQAKAAELGISETTLERAKDELGLQSDKLGLTEGWAWAMPEAAGSESVARE
jgi:hypothetical protein